MSDIVERLRGTREWAGFPSVPICVEAANEIERLEAALREMYVENTALKRTSADLATENERLRAALSNLLNTFSKSNDYRPDCAPVLDAWAALRSRAALEPPTH